MLDTVLDMRHCPALKKLTLWMGERGSSRDCAEALCQDRRGTETSLCQAGIRLKGFLEETMPELDLEGEEQVSYKKKSLRSEDHLPK